MQQHELIIIGLGISGIALAKEASKNNIDYLVLEKNKKFGGVWFNAPHYSTLQTHKDYYGYKDSEIPYSYSDYPTKNEVLKYLEHILNSYNILQNAIFNYSVENIIYDDLNNVWIIDNKYTSKYLGICSGYLTSPNIDIVNNELKNFKGNIIHTRDFNNLKLDLLDNKNILIVGNGASACDILNNLEKNNVKCNLTVIYKSAKYFIGKYIFNIPISSFLNHFLLLFGKYSPLYLYKFIVMLVIYFYFGIYHEMPQCKMNSKNLIANTIINDKIRNNTLVYLKDEIKYCKQKNIILKNNILLNIDTIILATGYKETYVFFKEQPCKEKYLQIFDEKFKNCAFIGFSPSYNWSKVSEKQSQIFIDYILGKITINQKNIEEYKKNHKKHQKYNNLPFNDLTYELYNY